MKRTPDYKKSPQLMAMSAAIKEARAKKNMTQRELGLQIGMGECAIQDIEQGIIGTNLFRVFQICEVLGITIKWEVQ